MGKPFTKSYTLRLIPASLWHRVKIAAATEGVTIRVWLLHVITQAL